MLALLRDLLARPGTPRTVILVEPDTLTAPRQYVVRVGRTALAAAGAVLVLAAGLLVLLVVTPLRGLVVTPPSEELRAVAEAAARRADALEDSMAANTALAEQLRALIVGDAADSLSMAVLPAVPTVAPRSDADPEAVATRASAYLDALRWPTPPPLDGPVSRPFQPTRGHFGLDLAVAVGTPVRALHAGTVVLAAETRNGGLVLALQHAGGYLSVYQHNSQLTRQVGERVAAREVVALSGNTGTVTSGPHLHVEIWRDGVPLDPAPRLLLR